MQWCIFRQIIKKEFTLFRRSLIHKCIDIAIIVACQVLLCRYLLPLTGMPYETIAPVFIGTIIQLCFSIGYGLSLRLAAEIEYAGQITYYLTLPLHTYWIPAIYATNFIVELTLATLPILFLASILLGKQAITSCCHIPICLLTYLLSVIMIASFFLMCSFSYSFIWFSDNLWPRRLSPIFLMSSILFPWKKVYAISHTLGILFLGNPFTYVAEGIRSTFIGGPEYFSPIISLVMISLYTILCWFLCLRSITQRLDPI